MKLGMMEAKVWGRDATHTYEGKFYVEIGGKRFLLWWEGKPLQRVTGEPARRK